MAEGGYFGYEDPYADYHIDHDDSDDEQEVNTTRPFQPEAASTPYHGGEQHEMQTMLHEQSGLPDTLYVETPLLGDIYSPEEKQSFVDRAKYLIKSVRPKVDFSKLPPIGIGKKTATQGQIVVFGPRGGETLVFKKDGSGLQKSFTDK